MPRRMLCRTVCVAALAGTILTLPGCSSGVDKTGPAVPPQQMDANKQKQYEDFMKSRGGGGAAPAAPGGAPGAPAAPGGAPGGAPANVPQPPHG